MNCNMQPLQFHAKNTGVIQLSYDDYEFKLGDKLYFTAKPKPDQDQLDLSAVIRAEWDFAKEKINGNGELELPLTPDDLDVDFGDYFYDIKLVSGDVSETIVTGTLRVLPVATLRA